VLSRGDGGKTGWEEAAPRRTLVDLSVSTGSHMLTTRMILEGALR
jgi:hypothetical protein